MRQQWEPNAPAERSQIECINRLLADRVLTGTTFNGHKVAPRGLTRLQANQAISDLTRLPYPDEGCRGGKCDAHSQCSRHGREYQRQFGRAFNE